MPIKHLNKDDKWTVKKPAYKNDICWWTSTSFDYKALWPAKFFQLRPQHVIEGCSAGTHSICVCEKHPNVKIMIDCLCKNIAIPHLFMDKLVCDINNHYCMMSMCASCPLNSVLLEHLQSFTNERVTIKQSESTVRTALAVSELPTDDF